MKAKTNYSALSGIVSIGHTDVSSVVSFAGGDMLLKKSDELYQAGQEQDARLAMREALKMALQRLDAVHRDTDGKAGVSALSAEPAFKLG